MPNPIILIIDDEEENRNSLRRYLKNKNPDWDIEVRENEQQAFDYLENKSPDVIVSDLVMTEEQGGMKILTRTKEKDPLIMVILFTAFEKKMDRYRAFELGAFDCVQKNTPGIIAPEEISIKTRAALAFRNMTLELLKKNEYLNFMKKYFDPKVFETIENNPSLLEVNQKTLCIVFLDIRGFSRLCEILKAHPNLISGFLREYFNSAAEVIFQHGGVLDKFIGDGVMAFYGALRQNGDRSKEDSLGAIHSAIDFQNKFDELLEKWMEEWKLYTPHSIDFVGLGCGIHTGDVLVGNVGSDKREEFTALGPHVNFASRLESKAKKGEILISQTVEARVHDQIPCDKVDTINDVKNIEGEFKVYLVKQPGRKK